MSRRRSFRGTADKRSGGRFIQIPVAVLESEAYRGLKSPAVKLLLDLNAQYKGDNNGDLCAAWTIMRSRGWRSEDTLNRAKKSLLASGILFETRKGARPNKASLYALTYYRLDECRGKLEVTLASFPFNNWMLKDPAPQIAAPGKPRAANASLATFPEDRKAA